MMQKSQIVYLQHETQRLYAEVIQIAETRPFCWVRPLAITVAQESELANTGHHDAISNLYDLREGADLLLPLELFSLALDTEVMPLLAQLGMLRRSSGSDRIAHHQLQMFVSSIWEACPDAFRT